MIAHIYDEISGDWTQLVIDDLNPDIGETLYPDDAVKVEEVYNDIESALHSGGGTGWNFAGYNRIGPILTIHSRSERGHDGITVINFNEKS